MQNSTESRIQHSLAIHQAVVRGNARLTHCFESSGGVPANSLPNSMMNRRNALKVELYGPDQLDCDPTVEQLSSLLPEADKVVNWLLANVAVNSTWGRSLRNSMLAASREIQIVRMTVLLGKPISEMIVAANQLFQTASDAANNIRNTRCDPNTAGAVRLILLLARTVSEGLAKHTVTPQE